jgi:hypothetical protein
MNIDYTTEMNTNVMSMLYNNIYSAIYFNDFTTVRSPKSYR